MAIKTNELPLVERFFPGGYIHGITAYYIKQPQKIGSPKTDQIKYTGNPAPATLGGLFAQLAQLHGEGATRVELQVLDKTGKKDFVEFHIDRLLPAEMLNPSPAKDHADFFDLVCKVREAQKEYFKTRLPEALKISKAYEVALDLKITEIKNPEKSKNQTEINF